MSDLVQWHDLYKQDDSGKRKHAQTVIERIRQNEKDNKGSDEEDQGDMRRRMARMKLLAGNDFSCKVEIRPIDNQKDHYIIMTQNGAPIVKIMPPYSSASSDQSLD